MDAQSDKKVTASSSQAKHMPSIGDLFSESWDTFKKSWLHLFVFILVAYFVLLLVVGVGVLLVVLTGAGAGLSAQANNFALSGGFAIIAGVGGLAFLVFIIVWSLIVTAGEALIVSENGQISLDATIKKSVQFILPLFLTGIVGGFIIIGGYFAFVIPGIILTIFLYFYLFEVVLDNKKGLDGLRSSISIVSQNFWGIFGRLLLLLLVFFAIEVVFAIIGGVSVLVPTLLFGKDSIVGGLLYIFVQIVSYIVGTVLGFYIISYYYTLYRHAKDAAVEKKGSLLWPMIIGIIGWVLAILIISAIWSSKDFQQGFRNALKSSGSSSTKYDYSSSNTTSRKFDASFLEQRVFDGINAYRTKNNLPVIQKDSQLCAYAQRRLEQLTKYGKWDDAKGFYEDTADPQIVRAYFQNLTTVNEEGWNPVTSATTVNSIVSGWADRKPGVGIVPNAQHTYGCVRGNGEFLILIGGATN